MSNQQSIKIRNHVLDQIKRLTTINITVVALLVLLSQAFGRGLGSDNKGAVSPFTTTFLDPTGVLLGATFYLVNTGLWSLIVFALIKPIKTKKEIINERGKRTKNKLAYLRLLLLGVLKIAIIALFFSLMSLFRKGSVTAAIFSFIICLILGSISLLFVGLPVSRAKR